MASPSRIVDILQAHPRDYSSALLAPLVQRSTVDDLVAVLRQSNDPDVIQRVCFILGHREGEDSVRAVPALAALLDANDPVVRSEAADALAHIASANETRLADEHGAGLCSKLIAALARESDASARANIAGAIGEIRCSAAGGMLRALLEDESPGVRREAAYALGLLRAEGHADISRAVAREQDEAARDAMLFALSQIPGADEPAT